MKPCLDTEAYNLPETVDSALLRIAPGTRRPHMCLAHIVRLSQGYAGLFPFLVSSHTGFHPALLGRC